VLGTVGGSCALFFLSWSFISSFIRMTCAFFMVVVAAGDVSWILIFAYVGTSCLYKPCLLKYILAQQFKSFSYKDLTTTATAVHTRHQPPPHHTA
jgi:hypothetical protein